MDALRVRPRFRLTPVFEWVVAALFLGATVLVGSMILRELPSVPARPACRGRPAARREHSGRCSRARAVSVPVLPFLDGKEIRIGETVSTVAARLGRAAESGRQEVDRGSLGERLTRFYEYAGFRFILVFEPFERNGEPERRGDLFAVEVWLRICALALESLDERAAVLVGLHLPQRPLRRMRRARSPASVTRMTTTDPPSRR